MSGERTRKEPHELAVMRAAGKIVAGCLAICREMARPGTRTRDIHDEVSRFIIESGAFSSFHGYDHPRRGPWFDGVICASVNEEVVHGVPGRRRLESGDIFSADCAVYLVGSFDEAKRWVPADAETVGRLRQRLAGARATIQAIASQTPFLTYHADAALTVPVGVVSKTAERLIGVTAECLERAIAAVGPGVKLSAVSRAVQSHAEANGFGVVRSFVGHGIGRNMHEAPQVPNFVEGRLPLREFVLRAGDALAIEPMVTEGTYECEYLDDGWTVVTRDRKLAAHFEHSVAVVPEGREVLTRD